MGREQVQVHIPGVLGEQPVQSGLQVIHRYRRTSLMEIEGCRTSCRRIALPAEPPAAGEPDEAAEVLGGTQPVLVQLPVWTPELSGHHPVGMPHRSGRILRSGLRVFHIQDRMAY
jgi:hypothetical protein